MSFIPKPHEIYKHFKGNLYQITAIAEHTETGERLVVYQALYGEFKTYARPLAMFTGRVDREKYPEASQEFRFELQGPDAERQRAEADPEISQPGTGSRVLNPETSQPGAGSRVSNLGSSQPGAGSKAPNPEDGTSGGTLAVTATEASKPAAAQEEEPALDPMLLEFLDANSYEERLNVLAGLHHRITDEMITTMAIACDVEVGPGDVEERYEALKSCLVTLERYECNRLR